MSIQQKISELKETMEQNCLVPENGLGDEMFLFASTLMPVVNVDLLVFDADGKILLSWRDDPHCGIGWHIPGGCIRFRESVEDRFRKTSLRELGVDIPYPGEVLHVFEIFNDRERSLDDQRERAHFITLVTAVSGVSVDISKQNKKSGEAGYLCWFTELPDNLLPVQNCYVEQWDIITQKLKGRISNGNLEK